jgi:hypothetical protein
MPKYFFSFFLLGLVILATGLTIYGAVSDHNGLFEAGSEALKTSMAGAIGAFASAMTK